MTALFAKRISFSSVLPVRFAVSNAAILLSVCLAFVGAGHLPQWLAWENGLFESAQNFVLLTGCWLAVYAALELQRPSSKALCAVAAVCWLVFFGREAAWGAVFMPPSGDSPWGPVWSSKQLAYRPLVPYAVGLLAVWAMFWMIRFKVWNEVLMVLVRTRAFPVLALLQFVGCMLISSSAEGHGLVWLHDWYGMQAIVLEEWAEVSGYLALLLAQASVLYHLRQWECPPATAV